MGGFYCPNCGTVQAMSNGLVTCRRCFGIGLAGFDNKRPTLAPCPVDGCSGSVWNDGGVNSAKAQHRYGWGGKEHAR